MYKASTVGPNRKFTYKIRLKFKRRLIVSILDGWSAFGVTTTDSRRSMRREIGLRRTNEPSRTWTSQCGWRSVGDGGLLSVPFLRLSGQSAVGPGPQAQHVVLDGPRHDRLGYALREFDGFDLRGKNNTGGVNRWRYGWSRLLHGWNGRRGNFVNSHPPPPQLPHPSGWVPWELGTQPGPDRKAIFKGGRGQTQILNCNQQRKPLHRRSRDYLSPPHRPPLSLKSVVISSQENFYRRRPILPPDHLSDHKTGFQGWAS